VAALKRRVGIALKEARAVAERGELWIGLAAVESEIGFGFIETRALVWRSDDTAMLFVVPLRIFAAFSVVAGWASTFEMSGEVSSATAVTVLELERTFKTSADAIVVVDELRLVAAIQNISDWKFSLGAEAGFFGVMWSKCAAIVTSDRVDWVLL